MNNFKKWLKEPMNGYDKFYAITVWILLILSVLLFY